MLLSLIKSGEFVERMNWEFWFWLSFSNKSASSFWIWGWRWSSGSLMIRNPFFRSLPYRAKMIIKRDFSQLLSSLKYTGLLLWSWREREIEWLIYSTRSFFHKKRSIVEDNERKKSDFSSFFCISDSGAFQLKSCFWEKFSKILRSFQMVVA